MNLFADIPANISEELTEVLAKNKHVRIERIVSQVTPAPTAYGSIKR